MDAKNHRHHHPHIPPEIEDIDPLSAEVFSAFRRSMHLSKQLLGRIMAEKGGHPGAAGVLRVLANNEGITQRDLAEMLQLSRPTVTTMLQRLEQHRLVERWDDEADQRLTRIRLTDAGREQATRFEASFAAYVDGTVGTMPEEDRRELARLLELLADTMARSLARHEETDPSGDDD
jgi:DNA-binding MarR family transcriptional regulator